MGRVIIFLMVFFICGCQTWDRLPAEKKCGILRNVGKIGFTIGDTFLVKGKDGKVEKNDAGAMVAYTEKFLAELKKLKGKDRRVTVEEINKLFEKFNLELEKYQKQMLQFGVNTVIDMYPEENLSGGTVGEKIIAGIICLFEGVLEGLMKVDLMKRKEDCEITMPVNSP